MSQFYALMSDNTVKHISLKEEIVTEIKNQVKMEVLYLNQKV